MRRISGGRVKQRTKQTCFSLFDKQTLGQLPSTPATGKPALWDHQQFTRNILVNNSGPSNTPLPCCSTWQQAKGSDSSHTFERFVWLPRTLVKVPGANWSTTSASAYSHLEPPRSCLLDIFTAFNIPLPPSAQWEVRCDACALFLHHSLCSQEGAFFFFAFNRILDTLQSSARWSNLFWHFLPLLWVHRPKQRGKFVGRFYMEQDSTDMSPSTVRR